jgi:pantoate--beta-alanine ligase
MKVANTRAQLADLLDERRDAESAVVMTMGALHEGHRALIRAARDRVGADGVVTVTIFVNPLQFGAGEDFDRYPRTVDADLEACRAEGADVVFTPTRDEMYPGGDAAVTVDPGPLGSKLEGAVRPTHFAGVLTVVAKLLNLTVPTYAFFGEKDYQQLVLIDRMVTQLEMPYEIIGVPTVREPDGLAMSSRNAYLTDAERQQGLSLWRALSAGAAAAGSGAEAVLAAARAELGGLDVDYLELLTRDLETAATSGKARLLVAARVGGTRLIDNCPVSLPGA